jgi:lysophospholipase L1-like esterase
MSALARFTLVCAGALGAALALSGQAQAQPAQPPKPVCALSRTGLDGLLERTRLRLSGRQALTIVAIGSSSTTGAGARTPAGSYPSRLEVFLKERFRGIPIRVVNRGVNGQEDGDMVARFERDVVAEKPDLILWQLGSNAVVRGRPLDAEEVIIRDGVERLKATGADVVLIDPQYTPLVIGKSGAEPMVELIAAEARRQDIGVFRRFELMKDWRANRHLPFEAFSVADGLHMNEWGYDCFARNLAAAIIESVAPKALASAPTASTH